jgi:hypothetical protein
LHTFAPGSWHFPSRHVEKVSHVLVIAVSSSQGCPLAMTVGHFPNSLHEPMRQSSVALHGAPALTQVAWAHFPVASQASPEVQS